MIRSFPKSISKVSLHLFIFNSFEPQNTLINVSKVIMVEHLVLRSRFGYVHVSVERYVFGPNITHFDIRDPVLTFEFRKNIAF